MFNSEQTVQFH